MKKTIVAATLTAVLAGTSLAGIAYAQQQRGERRAERLSDDDRAAFVDARLAGLKAGLKLTAEQDKLWPPVEAALREAAQMRAQRAAQFRQEREANQSDVDPIKRMRAAADMMAGRSATIRKLADAAEPLYKTLDEGQKRRLTVLMRGGGSMMRERMAWRHGGQGMGGQGMGGQGMGGPGRGMDDNRSPQ